MNVLKSQRAYTNPADLFDLKLLRSKTPTASLYIYD